MPQNFKPNLNYDGPQFLNRKYSFKVKLFKILIRHPEGSQLSNYDANLCLSCLKNEGNRPQDIRCDIKEFFRRKLQVRKSHVSHDALSKPLHKHPNLHAVKPSKRREMIKRRLGKQLLARREIYFPS